MSFGAKLMSSWEGLLKKQEFLIKLGPVNEEAMKHPKARGCYLPMGITSENVAKKYKISREKQDQYAFYSQKRAKEARDSGKFRDEIVPITVKVKDPKGQWKTVTVKNDEGIRDTTIEGLSKLRPAFKKDGKI